MRAENIETRFHSPTRRVIRLHGEHDLISVEPLSQALAAGEGKDHIVVDLTVCTFMDSTLIRTLLAAARRAGTCGGSVQLVVPTAANAVRRTLELANVQGVLPFHASCAEAFDTIEAAERAGYSAAA
jgi:anti-sigma B factor antagonist